MISHTETFLLTLQVILKVATYVWPIAVLGVVSYGVLWVQSELKNR